MPSKCVALDHRLKFTGSRRIIHTVAPRYSEKYSSAAKNALHFCYRSCLTLAKEENLKSIAFPCLHMTKMKFPIDLGAHIAIRM